MGQVQYNGKTVSDEAVKEVLNRIATELGNDVIVTSGDRGHVPQGGSGTSHHLQHRAVDFYVRSMTLATVFSKLKEKKDNIFHADKRYQVIHHGNHTSTGGQHLHVGRYETGTGVRWCTEGLTADSAGVYSCQ